MIKVHALGVTPDVDLREQIRSIDAAGLDGFFATDHLFVSHGKPRREAVSLDPRSGSLVEV